MPLQLFKAPHPKKKSHEMQWWGEGFEEGGREGGREGDREGGRKISPFLTRNVKVTSGPHIVTHVTLARTLLHAEGVREGSLEGERYTQQAHTLSITPARVELSHKSIGNIRVNYLPYAGGSMLIPVLHAVPMGCCLLPPYYTGMYACAHTSTHIDTLTLTYMHTYTHKHTHTHTHTQTHKHTHKHTHAQLQRQ